MSSPENSPHEETEVVPETTSVEVEPGGEVRNEKRIRLVGGAILRRILRWDKETSEIISEPATAEFAENLVDGVPTEREVVSEPSEDREDGDVSTEGAHEESSEDSITVQLKELGIEDAQVGDIKELLESSRDKLVERYLSLIGIEETYQEEIKELLLSSPVRLTIDALRGLGMDEDKVDEAHKILVSEKGRLRIKHIVDLGFGADKAEEVRTILISSPTRLLRQKLEELGLEEEVVDEIIAVGDDERKLEREILTRLDIPEDALHRIINIKEMRERKEKHAQELGYKDEGKVRQAHELGISDQALEQGRLRHHPIDTLITAVTSEHKLLLAYLVERGIELPSGREEAVERAPTRDERRKIIRSAQRVESAHPTGLPDTVTLSEHAFLVDAIEKRPRWLRNSLIPPGALGVVPDSFYHNRLTRPLLDIINFFYKPIGQRLLTRKLFKDMKRRHPRDDYGMLGRGVDKKFEILNEIKAVDREIRRARRLLSWHGNHAIKGDVRRVARIDLAQEIAEAKRALTAFGMGRTTLPSEREQYETLIDAARRTSEQDKKLEDFRRLRPKIVEAVEKERASEQRSKVARDVAEEVLRSRAAETRSRTI